MPNPQTFPYFENSFANLNDFSLVRLANKIFSGFLSSIGFRIPRVAPPAPIIKISLFRRDCSKFLSRSLTSPLPSVFSPKMMLLSTLMVFTAPAAFASSDKSSAKL